MADINDFIGQYVDWLELKRTFKDSKVVVSNIRYKGTIGNLDDSDVLVEYIADVNESIFDVVDKLESSGTPCSIFYTEPSINVLCDLSYKIMA